MVSSLQRRAILFQIKSSREKLEKLYSVAVDHFDHKRPLLIRTFDEKASLYVDKMLWSFHKASFLPHAFLEAPSQEMICICHHPSNPNQSKAIFNLTEKPILDDYFAIVYDFEDLTTPEKTSISSEKLKSYRLAQISIASF